MRFAEKLSKDVIDTWKTSTSADFRYFDSVEESVGGFWDPAQCFRQLFDRLNLDAVVEIACGKGRHSAQIVDLCRNLYLCDTSVDAIEAAKLRFKEYRHVSCHLLEEGNSLPFLGDESVTAVFSYDAMVHFDLLTVASYLSEISRVLQSGGMALLHHSNYSMNPTGAFTDNPGWRNFMSMDVMCYLASRAGLTVESQQTIDWSSPQSDGLTLLKRK